MHNTKTLIQMFLTESEFDSLVEYLHEAISCQHNSDIGSKEEWQKRLDDMYSMVALLEQQRADQE